MVFIIFHYVFTLIYGYLFSLLFNVDYTNFSSVWTYVLILISLLLGYICSIIGFLITLEVIGRFRRKSPYTSKFNHWMANETLQYGLHLMRIKVTVTGKENIPRDKNFVMYANHQENWDIMILKVIFRHQIINFIAKEALVKLPIFGQWITILGNIYISRTADRSAAESIVKGIKQVKNGTSMGIFPEGKRSFGNELIDFKPGAFKLAMKPKADILIVTQYDVCTIFKRFPWKRYHAYVDIQPVLKYEDFKDMKSQELAALVKARIQAKLDDYKETVK